jgi:hypothetical protein
MPSTLGGLACSLAAWAWPLAVAVAEFHSRQALGCSCSCGEASIPYRSLSISGVSKKGSEVAAQTSALPMMHGAGPPRCVRTWERALIVASGSAESTVV